MSQRIEGPRIIFNIPRELIDRVDHIAKKTNTTRSECLRTLIEVSCDSFEPFLKLGILQKVLERKHKLKEGIIKGIMPDLI